MITLLKIAVLFLVVLPSTSAFAGNTRIWQLAGVGELGKGEADGTRVTGDGEVELGRRGQKLDLEGVGLLWCAIRDKKGTIYAGTGYDGKILRIRGNEVVEIATTGQLVVTSLLLDAKGDLYAGTLPDAVIWKISNPGTISKKKPVAAKKWVTLPKDTKHVWALEYDGKKRIIYAGTGPEGKIYALGRDRKPQVFLDSTEEHILSLALGEDGKLFAGTSPEAILIESSAPGKARAVYDFEGTEVKAIIPGKKNIYVAVNKFTKPPAVPTKKDSSSGSKGAKSSSANSHGAGDGQIIRLTYTGKSEILFEEKKAHVTSLAMSREHGLFVGLGVDGRVLSIDKNRNQSVDLDLEERQVLALIADKDLVFAGTGDAGAAYRVSRARHSDAVYLSAILDAKTNAEWGRLEFFSRGKLRIQSRSGSTLNPDSYWSAWSKPLKNGSVIPNPPARYLQMRFSWAGDPGARLISAEVAFRGQNRRAVITEFSPESPFPEATKKSSDGNVQTSTRVAPSLAASSNDKEIDLTWKVDNPDGDTLRIQLWYRKGGEKVWRPITREDRVYKSKSFDWNTESVPEGVYQIRLVVDDSPENDPKTVLSDEFISVPVLVDNHQPEIKGLAFKNNTIKGTAVDGFSQISALDVTIDGAPWMPLFSKDGIFDEKTEEFEFLLPGELKPGPHSVGFRAFDRAGNMGTAEILIQTKAQGPK